MNVEPAEWTLQAKCLGMGDTFFTDATTQKQVKAICADCPVRAECLAEALDERIEWGVWGGLTERERRKLLRRRPDVTSWRGLLVVRRAQAA